MTPSEKYNNKIQLLKEQNPLISIDNIIEDYISYIHLPKKFINKSFEDYEGIDRYDIDWNNLSTKGYFFSGPVGTGKTFLSVLIAKALCIEMIGIQSFYKIRFYNEVALFQKLTRDISNSQPILDNIFRASFIIIDEIGGDPRQSDFVTGTRYYICNELNEREIPVIYIGNYNLIELKKQLGFTGPRIIDRILENCESIEFTGKSKR